MFSPEQYRALREGAGLMDRSDRGRLLLTGEDRRTYLQGLLTNDIAALTAGTGCYAALLTPQGRMIADMRVLELGDAIAIDLEGCVRETVRDRLDQFIFSEDAQVIDITDARAQLGVYGRSAAAVVAQALRTITQLEDRAPSSAEIEAMSLHANARWDRDGSPMVLVRSDDLGVAGFEVFADSQRAEVIRQALHAAGASDVDRETAEVCRIEAGRPLFGVDMDEDTIPLEAGIEDRAISLTKGCYVGQEIIIRVLHRGHGRVARRLVGLTLEATDSVPAHGDAIRSGEREIGRVTSAAISPTVGRAIALGYVRRDFTQPGTAVKVVTSRGEEIAAITELPFVRDANVGRGLQTAPRGGA
jgi:tRNA-modifying protein YgfZ